MEKKLLYKPNLKIRIGYVNNLTFKDVDDLFNLIRLSINDVFSDKGLSKQESNKIQIIDYVQKGSIDINLILNIVSTAVTVASFAVLIMEKIEKRISKKKNIEYTNRNHPDRPVYTKCDIDINTHVDNNYNVILNLHINNETDYIEKEPIKLE